MNTKTKHILTALIFLVFLYAHFAGMFFEMEYIDLKENRRMARLPELPSDLSSFLAFPDAFENYYHDHFGFRRLFVLAYNWMLTRFEGVIVNDVAMIGKNGWYYAPMEGYQKRFSLYSRGQLEQFRQNMLQRVQALAKLDKRMLYVIAPSKDYVFPEYLPDNLYPVYEIHLVDQIVNYLKNDPQIDILDLRPLFKNSPDREELFYPTDLHWSQTGAVVAVNTIAKHLQSDVPNLQPIGEDDLVVTRKTVTVGELPALLGLHHLYPEDRLLVDLKDKAFEFVRSLPFRNHLRGLVETENMDKSLPRAVVFTDSYGDLVRRYLPQVFSHISFSRNSFNMRRIRVDNPDVAIVLYSEGNVLFDMERGEPDFEYDDFAWVRSGERINLDVPWYVHRISLTARTKTRTKGDNYLEAWIGDARAGRWKIDFDGREVKFPIVDFRTHPGQSITVQLRLIRMEARGGSVDGHELPFDLHLRSSGGRKRNVRIIVNDSTNDTAPGYNLVHVINGGRVVAAWNFDTQSDPEASALLAATVSDIMSKSGYLLIASQENAGALLTGEGLRALRSLGSKEDLRKVRFYGHVLIYDLNGKRLVRELSSEEGCVIDIGRDHNNTTMEISKLDYRLK